MLSTLVKIEFVITRIVAIVTLSLSFLPSTKLAHAEGLMSFEGTSLNEQIQIEEPKTDQNSVSSSTVPNTQKQTQPTTSKRRVKNVQNELNRLGCNAGYPDGVIGTKTRGALKRLNMLSEKKFEVAHISRKSFIHSLMKFPDGFCQSKHDSNYLYAGEWNVKTSCMLVPGRGTLKLGKTDKEHIYSASFNDNWGVEAKGTFTLKGNDFDLKLKRKILRYSFTGSGSFLNRDYGEGWTSEACSFSMVRKVDG